MPFSLERMLTFARTTAYQAGQLTLQYFQKGLHGERKGDGSPVTLADRLSEELIRTEVQRAFPGMDILGEEFGSQENGGQKTGPACRWIIDPIDGTQSFLHGVPLYSILIGLEIEGTVELGVAYFPALNEMISAASGLGCWWNNTQTRVSPVDRLEDALISYTDLGNFRKRGIDAPLLRLADRAWCSAGWGDAYGYLLAATGRAEVMIDPIMEVWDCGPFPPIFREAGGYFGDWQGNATIYSGKALATSMALLPQVLQLLNE